MIKVENLTKQYAAYTAVDNVSFQIDKNEVVGLLGPNGAGKSTILKALSCYHFATGGRIEIGEKDAHLEPEEVKKQVGYLPENAPVYPEMRVSEYLEYRARIKGVKAQRCKELVRNAVARCKLEEVKNRITGQLSKGYRQRVGIADALVADPPVLILDEPTIGLDPKQIREVRTLIEDMGKEHTVLLSSHILPEVEAVCSRVIIINAGRICNIGKPEELRRTMKKGASSVRIEVIDPEDADKRVFEKIEGVVDVTQEEKNNETKTKSFTLSVEGNTDIREKIFDTAVENSMKLLTLSAEKDSLEDVFLEITTTENDTGRHEASADEEIIQKEEVEQ